jgi:hypothetical protein
MKSHPEHKIRFATSPYFLAMLVVWPIVIAYHAAVEGEDIRMGIITLNLLWWSLAAAGSILNFRKWKRLGRGGRRGVVILGFLWIAPLVYGLYLGIIGIFHGGVSL